MDLFLIEYSIIGENGVSYLTTGEQTDTTDDILCREWENIVSRHVGGIVEYAKITRVKEVDGYKVVLLK